MDSRLNTRTEKRVDLPTRVGQLTVSTGKVTLLPYDPSSGEDLQMVEDLGGWSRTYEAEKEAAGTMTCYTPDPDRLFTFSASLDHHGLDIVEAGPK
jgi:hypothetical protein